jgi:hypothetical protein
MLGKYKVHREECLLDREKALLPASQHLVHNFREAKRLRKRVRDLMAERNTLYAKLRDINVEALAADRDAAFIEQSRYVRQRRESDTPEARERRRFVRACPVPDCRGFLSTAWKCGICDARVCKECGELRPTDEHACNPDAARSHAMIQKDSRPCPKCACMIFKVSGCDQMFCTQCHVSFSWKTGEVVTSGVLHNPHMFEWLRQTRGTVPRQPGDVPCGGAPHPYHVDGMLKKSTLTEADKSFVLALCRCANHLEGVSIPRLRDRTQADVEPHMQDADLRLQFLMNCITEDEWKKQLQQRDKKRESSRAELHVHEMFVVASADLMRNMMAIVRNQGDGQPSVIEMRALLAYTNECITSIAKRFGLVPQLLLIRL